MKKETTVCFLSLHKTQDGNYLTVSNGKRFFNIELDNYDGAVIDLEFLNKVETLLREGIALKEMGKEFKKWYFSKDHESIEEAIERITGVNINSKKK